MPYQHDALIDMPNLSNSDLSSTPHTRQNNINNNPTQTHDSHSVSSHGRRNRERRQSRMGQGMNLPPLRERDILNGGGKSNDGWEESVHSSGMQSNGSRAGAADPGDMISYHNSHSVAEKRPSLRSMADPPPPLQEIDVDEKTAEGEQSYSTNSEFDSIKSRFFNRVNNVAASAARRTTGLAGGGRADGPNNDRRYQELMAEHNKAIERYIEFEDQNKRLVGELMEVKFEMANMAAKQDQYEMTIRQLKDENDALKVKIESMEDQILNSDLNKIEVVPDDDESLLTLDMSLYNRAQSKGKLRSHKTLSQTEDDDSDHSDQPVNRIPRPNSPQHSVQSISLASQSAQSQTQSQHTSSRSLRRKNKVRVVRRTNSNASIGSRSIGSNSASHRSRASRTRYNNEHQPTSIVRTDSVTRIEEEPAIPTTIEGNSMSSRSIDEQNTRTRRPRAIPADRLFKIVGNIRNKPGGQQSGSDGDDHPRRSTNIGAQIGDKFDQVMGGVASAVHHQRDASTPVQPPTSVPMGAGKESRRNFGFQRRFGRWQ